MGGETMRGDGQGTVPFLRVNRFRGGKEITVRINFGYGLPCLQMPQDEMDKNRGTGEVKLDKGPVATTGP